MKRTEDQQLEIAAEIAKEMSPKLVELVKSLDESGRELILRLHVEKCELDMELQRRDILKYVKENGPCTEAEIIKGIGRRI